MEGCKLADSNDVSGLGKAVAIRYLVMDVDGTMTDGGIYYDSHGNELKKFCTRDAAAFFASSQCGIKTIILTGRECAATERRMHEIGVDYLFQGVSDKALFLTEFMEKYEISKGEIGYIGDDLNDLAPMKLVGFIGCPADSCKEVLEIADYVSKQKGGDGAVRDVVEAILRYSGKWDGAVSTAYSLGR